MGVIPAIRAARLVAILLRLGFRVIRQVGSHARLEHIIDKTRKVTVPIHNKDLQIKTLLSILRQAKISLEEFLKLLSRK